MMRNKIFYQILTFLILFSSRNQQESTFEDLKIGQILITH